MSNQVQPPVAPKHNHDVFFGAVDGEKRGEGAFPVPRVRNDPWFWLRDDERKNPEVLEHLRQENAYAAQETAHLDGLRKTLYDEHISHLKETDDAPPYISGPWFYYSRTVKGKAYRIHCRKPRASDGSRLPAPDAVEEVLLDENQVAEGHNHCDIHSVKPSPDHSLLAYAVDFTGDEVYSLVVMDLATREILPDRVEKMTSGLQWGNNNSIFYLTQDATKRPYRMWRHQLGDENDSMLFEENDEQFWLGMGKSNSGRFIFAASGSTETSEYHFFDLQSDAPCLTLVQPRQFGLRYDVEHDGHDSFIVCTNINDAINNRLMRTPIESPGKEFWQEIIPYDPTRKISGVEVFSSFMALDGRQDGLTQLWLMQVDPSTGAPDTASFERMEFDEELYEVGTHINKEFTTPFLRMVYSSLTTPTRYLDVDTRPGATPRDTLIKEQPVLNFDRSLYECRRIFATAPDKTQIPMSLVYRKDLYDDAESKQETADGKPPAPRPLHLYGYGSYGICIDPGFHRLILPYLDRGMVYCIAHIRGGGEMGRYWYEEQGKYLTKRNTFQDFISCAEHLVEQGFTKPELMSCEGRSAGGLLMGNVVNMRPDLFKVAVAGVPFVDLMTTMCDPSIPLTTNEWEEWGNPNTPKYFDYMLSYSPMDNVRAQEYPNILITAGLYDPRVAYWEPAKWASKLRELKAGTNVVVAKFDLDSGHFSASDRYKYLREKAYDQSFVLDKLGLADVPSKANSTADDSSGEAKL